MTDVADSTKNDNEEKSQEEEESLSPEEEVQKISARENNGKNQEVEKGSQTLPNSNLFAECSPPRNDINRVKIYLHSYGTGVWGDKGTGHVMLTKKEEKSYLHFKREDNEDIFHDWQIIKEASFIRQQDTLIIFSHESCSREEEYQIALSFQSTEGAEHFWRLICNILERDPNDLGELDLNLEETDDEEDDLPIVTIGNLSTILRLTAAAQRSPTLKKQIEEQVINNNWIFLFKNLYEMCDDMGDTESAVTVSRIVKNLLMLNSNKILKHFFNNSMNLVAVTQLLSYVPDEKNPQNHIEYLLQNSNFKQIITISKSETIEKIKRAYHVQYLVDVCLPITRISIAMTQQEDLWTIAMDTYLSELRTEILVAIMREKSLKPELIDVLQSRDIDIKKRREMVSFLSEYFRLLDDRNLTAQNKKRVLKGLIDKDFMKIIKPCILWGDYGIHKLVIEIFQLVVKFDVREAFKYIEEESINASLDKDTFILSMLIRLIDSDPDPELQLANSVSLLLRLLLGDVAGSEEIGERQQFLGSFFLLSFRKMLQSVIAKVQDGRVLNDNHHSSRKTAIHINIIAFCIKTYPTLAKIQTIQTNALNAIATTIKSKICSLSLAAIKLIKSIMQMKCIILTRHMLEDGALAEVTNIFCDKYIYTNNLFNSCYLDLFEFVLRDGFDEVVAFLIHKYGKKFDSVDYCSTFSDLRSRFNRIIAAQPQLAQVAETNDGYFSDEDVDVETDETESSTDASEIHEEDFKPRAKVEINEEIPFANPAVRPPTPMHMRIVLKQKICNEDGDKDDEAELLAPLRLVAYDSDSDSDEESKGAPTETNFGTNTETDDGLTNLPASCSTLAEQRGVKRRSSTTEDADVVKSKRNNVSEI